MAIGERFGWGERPGFLDPKPPRFYDCGICGHYHPIGWNGDCRDDDNRFTANDLDEKYGENEWEDLLMPGTPRYDWHCADNAENPVCVVELSEVNEDGEFEVVEVIAVLPVECEELAEAMAEYFNEEEGFDL